MDILIKADEILSAIKYKSGKACLWVDGFQKVVEIPEHGDLVEISKVKEAQRIHGQASPWDLYVPIILEANNGTDS